MARKNDADYDVAISALFKTLISNVPSATDVQCLNFCKSDLVEAIRELEAEGIIDRINNIPDIKYTYAARREFPKSILEQGYWAITGRGKSQYSFTRLAKSNLIRVPGDLPFKPEITVLKDRTPELVRRVLSNDEQATAARVRFNNLLRRYFGFDVYHVQGHERTFVSGGQIEVDEVFVGEDGSGSSYVIPITGKGGEKDCFSYCQALNLNLYATEKARYKGFIPRPLGVTRKADGTIYVVEFSPHTDIRQISIIGVAAYVLK